MSDVVLVLGASSDIGIDLIRRITDKCLVLAHFNSSSEALTRVSRETKNQLVPLQADFSCDADIDRFLDTIEAQFGIPNKIVHLPAPTVENIRFRDVTWQHFEQNLNIGLKSAVLVFRRFLPKLAKATGGRVVVVLSSYTFGVPPKALAHYVSAKYALLGLVKALAAEYGDKNITVNAVSPSMVETKFLDKLNKKLVELSAEGHPLKRIAVPSDITPLIKFLLSNDATYINGVNIPVSGGGSF